MGEAAKKPPRKRAKKSQIATAAPKIKLAPDTVEKFILRGRTQPAHKGRTFSSFAEALACTDYPEPEPIIEWHGLDETAALDVDFHKNEPPSDSEYYGVIRRTPLKPDFWWVTHNRGARLIFTATSPLSAHECAAIARLLLKRELPYADGWEILPRTRHPSFLRNGQRCGHVYLGSGDGLDRAKQTLLGDTAWGDADSERVAEWLEENGLEIGKRYDHDRCPVDPSDHGKNQPVVVLDGGIHCHKCDKFTPFSRLIDGEPIRVKNHLRSAVRNLTHWQHARHIIDDEVAYRGLLKLWHLRGDEARDELVNKQIGKTFFPPIDMVRSNDRWLWSTDFSPVEHASLEIILKQMPALQFIDENGKVGTKPLALAKFLSAQDLTDFGYPNIEILRGVDIAAKARSIEDDEKLYALRPASPPFKYRPPSERDISPIERCFPGVRIDLLKLLIAAKGVLQGGGNPEIPRIFIVGQSGSAKSAHVRLAANITGEREAECDCGDDRGKFVRGYADASMVSSYALFNEVAKKGLSDSELRGRFLGLERGMQYHAMYYGTANICTPAVIVCTDVELPRVFQTDTQLARRFVVVDLGAGRNETDRDWYVTCESGSIQQWRDHPYSLGANAEAADSLISEVIDEFFANEPVPTFAEIAKRLGFGRLSDDAAEVDSELRELYDAVMVLPEETEGHFAQRGPGWRKWHTVHRSQDTELAASLWNELTNNGTDLQRLKGANWSKITGIPGMRFSEHKHRGWQGVRFAPERRGGAR